MDISKRQIPLAVALVFAVLGCIFAVTTYTVVKGEREHVASQAELNAKVYVGELERDFDRAVFVTEALEEVIVSSQGDLRNFDAVAADLMRDFVGSIQIAPDGVVTEIYPAEGNEDGLIDLMSDPVRGPVVAYGREHDLITVQGPFELRQGGRAIAVRDPVFLADERGEEVFWGFTIVIIRADEIFHHSLSTLETFGYDYRLTATTSPLTDEFEVVLASNGELDRPVVETFAVGACTWRLEVAPKAGWRISRASLVACVIGGMFVLLIVAAWAALLDSLSQRRRLRRLAETDPLTGLYNRTGIRRRVNEYLAAHPSQPITEVLLDIDDFKIVNDLHGHVVGDLALQNLAKNLVAVLGEKAVVARTGGDEFGVFFPGMTAEEAEPYIRRASELDQTFADDDGKVYTYTISMGFADYPAQASSREELTRNVDSALYTVKLNGKHGCQRYAPGMVLQTRQQLGFTQKELLRSIPGVSFICHAQDTCILYANEDLITLLECDDYENFSAYSEGVFRNIAHPDDFERVMRERQQKLAGASAGEYICCGFRVVSKTGTVHQMQAQTRFQHHETYGDLFFVNMMEEVC